MEREEMYFIRFLKQTSQWHPNTTDTCGSFRELHDRYIKIEILNVKNATQTDASEMLRLSESETRERTSTYECWLQVLTGCLLPRRLLSFAIFIAHLITTLTSFSD